MNDLAREKLQSLESAVASYTAAAAALPASEALATWDTDWNLVKKSDFIHTTQLRTPTKRGLAQCHDVFSTFTPIPPRRFTRESIGALIPSPLHIKTDVDPGSVPNTPPRSKPAGTVSNAFRKSQCYLPFTPPKNVIPSSPPFSARRRSITFSASPFQWLQDRSARRYNAHLTDFANMLRDHRDVVENLISDVKDIQGNKRVKRLASFGEDREARAADLRERIVRLRAKGWRRERFSPEKYQRICALALAEL
ncbi:MAG: hypothetical protein Q9208_005979 [Pyrenodesmia sp. 3 TL-2023]